MERDGLCHRGHRADRRNSRIVGKFDDAGGEVDAIVPRVEADAHGFPRGGHAHRDRSVVPGDPAHHERRAGVHPVLPHLRHPRTEPLHGEAVPMRIRRHRRRAHLADAGNEPQGRHQGVVRRGDALSRMRGRREGRAVLLGATRVDLRRFHNSYFSRQRRR